ncbi:MAG: hypothetical protein ACRC6M_19515 [Microcystaceae cyanobacterium]
MPRLVGKKINLALYAGLGFLIAGIAAIALDYLGVVNFIPNFGPEANTNNTSGVKTLPPGK